MACGTTKKLLVLLVTVGLVSGFQISVTTEQSGNFGQGGVASQVVLELGHRDPLGEEGPPRETLQPLNVMQMIQRQMQRMFDDVDMDMDSFFSDPLKHLRGIERALMHRGAPREHRDDRDVGEVLEHMREHSRDPKTLVAAACHSLLHRCLTRVTDSPESLWEEAYQCIVEHQKSASRECRAVVSHTREALDDRSEHKDVERSSKKIPQDPKTDDLKGEATPGYLLGDVEAPKGVKDMGGWTARVYTEEQQQRLLIDEFGEALDQSRCLGVGYSCAKCMGRKCCCDGLVCDESGPPKCSRKPTTPEPTDAPTKAPPEEVSDEQSKPDGDVQLQKPDDKPIEPAASTEGREKEAGSWTDRVKYHLHRIGYAYSIFCLVSAVIALLLCGCWIYFSCCFPTPESLDTTYEVLLQSDATKHDGSDASNQL